MENLKEIFAKINQIRKRADKLILTRKKQRSSDLDLVGISGKEGIYRVEKELAADSKKFLFLMGEITGWNFREECWTYENMELLKFTKGATKASGIKYEELLEKEPLSMAITSTDTIEYTVEGPSYL